MDRVLITPTPSRPRLWRSLCAAMLLFSVAAFPACTTQLEILRKQGIAEYKKEDYDKSLETLNQALSHGQFDPQSNVYAGLIHYRAKNYVQAEYHLRLALQGDPSSEEAKAGLTATLIAKGRPDEALDALERAAELAEKVNDPRWQKNGKRVYTKEVEERLFFGRVNDRIRIARAYERLGDYDNSLVYYKKALEVSPANANVLMSIADLCERAGNKTETRNYLRKAYLANPGLPGITEAMTRNGLAISDVLSPPLPGGPAPSGNQ